MDVLDRKRQFTMNFSKNINSVKTVTIIIPVHNESEALDELLQRINSVTCALPYSWSYLFIDDHSSDTSLAQLKRHRQSDPRIGIVSLSRCFGKEAALSAGLAHADADAVVLMDADLQDPPECLPRMLKKWQSGFDVVAMKRADRRVDTRFKRFCANGFYSIMRRISDVPFPADVGDFRLMSRKVITVLNLLPESNRCMKGLFAWAGFKTTQVDYVRESRCSGQSQWPLVKLVKLAVDGITAHSIAPLRLATYSGALVALLAVAFGLFTIAKTLTLGESVAGYTTLLTLVTFLGGLQLLAIGVMGEYVGRIYIESKRRPVFVVDEVLPSSAKSQRSSRIASVPVKYKAEAL